MSYLDQSRSPSPTSMAAVIAVHAAMAAALVVGLTVTGVIKQEDGPMTTITPYTPPPPEPVDTPKPTDTTRTVVAVPTPPLELKPQPDTIPTDKIFPPPTLPDPVLGKVEPPAPTPSATASFAPVAARPRNDPARWLSDADYKASWARQDMVGTARFRLDIAADGRVMGCEITRSTGHAEMDAATCALVSKRAKFEPARGGEGEPVAGSYSGSVRWQLPR